MKQNAHTAEGPEKDCGAWTTIAALQLAWTTWVVLLVLPFVLLPLTLHLMPISNAVDPNPELAERWYDAVMIYLIVVVPLALVFRACMFHSFWRGRAVRPRRYYAGMLLVWSVVLAAGLTAELVCVATATVVPNALPAILSLFVYLMLWPTGRAMEDRHWNGSAAGGANVETTELEPAQWPSFFDRFSRRHAGRDRSAIEGLPLK